VAAKYNFTMNKAVYVDDVEQLQCSHCFHSHCLVVGAKYQSLIMFYDQHLCEDDGEHIFPTNKHTRVRLYKHMAFLIHGVGSNGFQIPCCVKDKILVLAPRCVNDYVTTKPTKIIMEGKENQRTLAADDNADDNPYLRNKRIKVKVDTQD
jgi:hypothetical protein